MTYLNKEKSITYTKCRYLFPLCFFILSLCSGAICLKNESPSKKIFRHLAQFINSSLLRKNTKKNAPKGIHATFLQPTNKFVGHYLILFFFLLINSACLAQTTQNTLSVNLEDVLQLAGANSQSVQIISLKKELAQQEYKYAKSWWAPEITAGIAAHQLNGAAMNSDGIFFLDVDRQSFWGGGAIGLELDLGQGISHAAAAKNRASSAQYRSRVERNDWLMQVAEVYMELQSAQMHWQTEQTLKEKSESIVQQMEVQKEAGLIYTSDLLLAKSNLSHYTTSSARYQIQSQRKALELAAMLNLAVNTQLITKDSFLAPVELINTQVVRIDFATIADNHPLVLSLQDEINAFKKDKQAIRNSLLLPKIQLSFSGGLFGDIISPTDRNGNEIESLYNTFQFNGGLLWRWPLEELFGSGRSKMRETQVQISRSNYAQGKLDLNATAQAAFNQINIAREALRAAEEGFDFASEALSQSIERQKHRTAEAYEVFQAQEFYKQAQMDLIEAISLYNMGQMRLFVALGNDL